MEEWKTIKEYPDYQVSNFGRVKSLERKAKMRNGYRTVRERVLKAGSHSNGYQYVVLCCDGKVKTIDIHRLVACAFIPNPENLPVVNHKDENKTNNHVENLEWCTHEYNNNFGTRNERVSKSVCCVETGEIFSSLIEVQRQLGFAIGNISNCCNGKLKSAYKYHWKWV